MGEEREGSGLYCPIRSTNCFPALKTSSPQHFGTGCVHSVALRSTPAGPLGKPQLGLTQHGLTPLPVPSCSPGPATRIARFHFVVAYICRQPTAAPSFGTCETGSGDHCLAAGRKNATGPRTLWLLGIRPALPKAESSCRGLCTQLSQGMQKAADLGPAAIFNL